MGRKILWQELRRTEFEEASKANAVVVIPVASIEQHGNHLPVNTDSCDCYAIAQRAAQAIEQFPVLVLPLIWTGFSPYHMPYGGTITIKYQTLVQLLTEVAVSVHAHGFRKIFFLNGHGGNGSIIAAIRSKLACEDQISSVVGYTWWNLPSVVKEMKKVSESDKGCIGHAGELETSIQLYLQPELVDTTSASWSRGVNGDPSTATREKGERLIGAAVNALVEVLRDFHSGKLEEDLLLSEQGFEGRKIIPDSWVPK